MKIEIKKSRSVSERFDKILSIAPYVKSCEVVKKRRFNLLAFGLITFGILTLPFPTGSILFIAMGLGMLGLSFYRVKTRLKKRIFLKLYELKAKRGRK